MHSYQHNIKTFNNATRALTRVERSLYRDLIEMYYDTEQPLPASNFDELCRDVIAQTDDEKAALRYVLGKFFVLTGDVYTHDYCDEQIDKFKSGTNAKSLAGIASAKARKQKSTDRKKARSTKVEQNLTAVEQPLSECLTAVANHKPITINQEPIYQQQQSNISISDWAASCRDQLIKNIEYRHDIPDLFCQSLEHEFIDYWQGKSADNWDSRFIDRCVERWSSFVGESWRKRFDSG